MDGKKTTFVLLAIFVIAVTVIAGCTQPTPPATATPTPTPTPTMTPAPKTIVETAIADGRFNTLVSAVQAANLVGTLNGAGPFTVFAPTDNAFNNLPPGTVATLLKE
ncbi:MAG: fasciclin domain-containing protein, partial [Methanoregulaceae archaeon]|nr:fasciclin domain-containing protein [Methanoregulaceae archaeon]